MSSCRRYSDTPGPYTDYSVTVMSHDIVTTRVMACDCDTIFLIKYIRILYIKAVLIVTQFVIVARLVTVTP